MTTTVSKPDPVPSFFLASGRLVQHLLQRVKGDEPDAYSATASALANGGQLRLELRFGAAGVEACELWLALPDGTNAMLFELQREVIQ